MFQQAHNFAINHGQFIYCSDPGSFPQSALNQNATITYEKIRLATPAAPTVFTGRDELMAEAVKDLCHNEQAHIAILGAGGMGKTALALHILKDEAVKDKFRERIYFVPCELFSDGLSLIQGLVQALKLSVTVGHSPYEAFEKHLKSSDNPMLIVLDNFETPWHSASDQNTILNLTEQIMSQELVSIILTMRATDGPGYHKWHKLGGHCGLPTLDLDAARQAFMLISKSQSEDVTKLNWLLKEVDCMPLAVLLIGQLKRHLSLDTLIRKWKTQKAKMLKTGMAADRQTNISSSIDISLEILQRSQNPDCIKILPILSFLPNGVLSWQETLGELIVEPDFEIEESVISLCQLALIYEENNGLKMLSPIREDLQNKYPAQAGHLRQIGRYYISFLDYYSPGKGQNIVENHGSNITRILETQLRNLPEQRYLAALHNFAEYTKFSSISVRLIDIALTQTWDDNFEEEIRLRFAKEQRLFWLGDYQRGVAEIQAIQLILRDVNIQQSEESKAKHLANCFLSLGNIFYIRNEYSEAKSILTNAKIQFEKFDDQLGVAHCLHRLGSICHMQNENSEAKSLLTYAKIQFEKIGNQLGAAQCIKSLGIIDCMQGEYSKAKMLLTEAQAQFNKVDDQLGAAQCLRSLAKICGMQDEYLEAISLLTDAKTQFESIGDQLGAALCLRTLGDIDWLQDRYSEAKLLLTHAKTQSESIGNPVMAAQCLQILGDLCGIRDEYSEAKLLLNDAKSQFKHLGHKHEAAQCLRSLGYICCIQGRYPEARLFLTDARNQFEKIGHHLQAVQCLQSLGDICRLQGEYSEAKSLLTHAKTQFEKIGYHLGAAQCLQSEGDAYRMQNQYSKAKLLLADAKTRFENIGHQLRVAQCHQSLANICRMQEG